MFKKIMIAIGTLFFTLAFVSGIIILALVGLPVIWALIGWWWVEGFICVLEGRTDRVQ
jgi:hypothetical protein